MMYTVDCKPYSLGDRPSSSLPKCSLLTHDTRKQQRLCALAVAQCTQFHIKHFELLGTEKCRRAHGGPQLRRHHYAALSAHPHALDALLESCTRCTQVMPYMVSLLVRWWSSAHTRDEAADADACLCGPAPQVSAVNPRPCIIAMSWLQHVIPHGATQ